MRVLGVVASTVALAAFAAGAHASATIGMCDPSHLKGTLSELPYSRTPTTLHYQLLLTNTGADCGMSGAPTGVLLGKTKRPLATHVLKPVGSQLFVILRGGQSVRSSVLMARVAAKGESKKACEPVAYWFRVRGTNGHGAVDVPIKPPARACRFGRLDVTYYGPTS